MKPHEIHLEFMKAIAIGNVARGRSVQQMAKDAILLADVYLNAYRDRWPELKEKES